jgi:hypothetical protein
MEKTLQSKEAKDCPCSDVDNVFTICRRPLGYYNNKGRSPFVKQRREQRKQYMEQWKAGRDVFQATPPKIEREADAVTATVSR